MKHPKIFRRQAALAFAVLVARGTKPSIAAKETVGYVSRSTLQRWMREFKKDPTFVKLKQATKLLAELRAVGINL
jgi:transposase